MGRPVLADGEIKDTASSESYGYDIWPFPEEIVRGAPDYGDADFGNSGSIYVFDYTLIRDPRTNELKPLIFECQSVQESSLSALRVHKEHYNGLKINYRAKEKIAKELGIAEKFKIEAHVTFSKAQQRKILIEAGCDDLQPNHVVIDKITDHGYGVRYGNLCEARSQKIAKFIEENPDQNFVLKLSSAARGEGNKFISRYNKDGSRRSDEDLTQIVIDEMSELYQDGEFSLEVETQHYQSLNGKKTTFRSVIAVDQEGRHRGIKHWITLHQSADSHNKDGRYYLLERAKAFPGEICAMDEKNTRLEEEVERDLGRAAMALRMASKEVLRTSSDFILTPETTISARKIPSQPTSISEYLDILDDLFTEEKAGCLPCFTTREKPPHLLEAEELAKSSKGSGVEVGGQVKGESSRRQVASFIQPHFFNLIKDSYEKDLAEGSNKRISEIVNKLNSVGYDHLNADKRKGYYKIKKLIFKMTVECVVEAAYSDETAVAAVASEDKPAITAFLMKKLTVANVQDFILRYEAKTLREETEELTGRAKDYQHEDYSSVMRGILKVEEMSPTSFYEASRPLLGGDAVDCGGRKH